MLSERPSPLVGQAVGDALGMPFETESSTSASLLAWDGSYQPSAYHRLSPGQWTDDTMMAKLLAESLVARGGYYPADVAERYLQWFRLGPEHYRGMGKATKEALSRLDGGVPWCKSGVEGAEGNGSAMRAPPIGMFFAEDLWTTKEFALIDARITHASHEAAMGSAAVAVAVALIIRNEALPSTLSSRVVEFVDASHVRDGLETVQTMISARVTPKEALGLLGTNARVVQTVPAAFAAFALTSSYGEAIEVAIRAGGDTDTTAAITGAFAGSYYGIDSIPAEAKNALEEFAYLHRLERELQAGPRGLPQDASLAATRFAARS